jgi:hypothetical protein
LIAIDNVAAVFKEHPTRLQQDGDHKPRPNGQMASADEPEKKIEDRAMQHVAGGIDVEEVLGFLGRSLRSPPK